MAYATMVSVYCPVPLRAMRSVVAPIVTLVSAAVAYLIALRVIGRRLFRAFSAEQPGVTAERAALLRLQPGCRLMLVAATVW